MMFIADKTRSTDGPPPFEFEVNGNCANDWKIWLRSFEIYAKASDIKKPDAKLNWLLHYAGSKVQTVFYTLPAESKNDETTRSGPLAAGYVKSQMNVYEDAIVKLCQFFEPKQNVTFERHMFRRLKQNDNERIDMFIMRLREQAERCDFGDQIDDNVRDQITSGCSSDVLRRKILGKDDASLDDIIKMARILEVVAQQQKSFGQTSVNNTSAENRSNEIDVCKIDAKSRFSARSITSGASFNGYCGRCGRKGHKSDNDKCPAKGKTCNKCGRKDHFARKCFLSGSAAPGNFKRKAEIKFDDEPKNKIMKRESVQMVDDTGKVSGANVSDEYEDVFAIDAIVESNLADENKIWCVIGNIETEVTVDSGSRYNIIDRLSWIDLKAKNIHTLHKQREIDINFRAYGGQPLKFVGMFRAVISIPGKQIEANFYVADEFGKVLLGYETAKELGVLIIRTGTVNAVDAIKPLGKIKGVLIDIPIKSDAKGVIQPYRRVPAPLEKLVDKKIDEMLHQDIIEKVNGVAKFISPVVVAPKGDNDIRICVDMRQANMMIERENHPLPTMDDFLPHLNEATVFSKLDVKQAYHQVDELD